MVVSLETATPRLASSLFTFIFFLSDSQHVLARNFPASSSVFSRSSFDLTVTMHPVSVGRIGGGASRVAAARPSAQMRATPIVVVGRRQAMRSSSAPLLPLNLHHHSHRRSTSSSVVRASEDDDKGTDSSTSSSSTASKFTVIDNDKLPLGKPTFDEKTAGAKGAIRFRLAFALPWRRFKSDSVLVLDVSGGIGEKRAGRFAPSALTMPQVRERRGREEKEKKKFFPDL